MSKVNNKNKEVLDQLYSMVVKEAASANAKPNNISGEPGKDTNFQSVSEGTETTDKNNVGADKLKPQNYEQKPQTDESTPVKASEEKPEAAAVEPKKEEAPKVAAEAPKAEEKPAAEATPTEVAKLASDLLAAIEKMSGAPKPNNISGVPGKDTHFQSVSDKTEKTDKNNVGADKLKPQDYSQKPATDPSKPVAKAAEAPVADVTAEDVDKVASYELGKQLAEAIFKQAQANELEQIKIAGRRDFELLVAQASQELQAQDQKPAEKTASVDKEAEEKQAEEAGAEAFQDMLKTARYEYAITELNTEVESLKAKVASLEQEKLAAEKKAKEAVDAKEAFIAQKAAEEREAQKMAAWSEHTVDAVMQRLKTELFKGNA